MDATAGLADSLAAPGAGADLVRRRVRVRGQVQGVGFRPFVYRLARELGIDGWVRNDGAGVEIEMTTARERADRLLARLQAELPALARVSAVEVSDALAREPASPGFAIADSGGGPASTAVTPDAATCPECLRELLDPSDRRYRYPFINCTHCGPRYTITRRLPYDRPHTSMARFRQCPACSREYETPVDRRFHAQPNACPVCGPRLVAVDPHGTLLPGDPIGVALGRLRAGEVVALKGLGGFHLACDARNALAVSRLRARKNREEKPLAVMVAGIASLAGLAAVDAASARALASVARPIVLLRKRTGCDATLPGVAPGLVWLGAMLPYTPLQWLLFHEAAGRPAGTAWLDTSQPLVLVMTSANPGGEPIVRDDDEALQRLAGIADALLIHDREVVTRCDDSVLRVGSDGIPRFLRRARGFTPQSIRLPAAGPPVLATGAFLKNAVCLTRGDEAFLSQHVGDLDNAAGCRMLEETVARMMDLLEIDPEVVAHDLHPDFASSRFAVSFAAERGLPLVAVQHHHAHLAAVAAEHGVDGPLLGLALDGVGLGSDGGAWGGELLRVDGGRFDRIGHLAELPLPGGDRAAREPWRMAAAVLHRLGAGAEIGVRFAHRDGATLAAMLDRNVRCPRTSSMGRWFDAAAALVGVREVAAFEGQTAMLLEGLAATHGPVPALDGGWSIERGVLDFSPLLRVIVDLTRWPGIADYAAALFHATVAAGLVEWASTASARLTLRRVALGGGCFMNHVLATAVAAGLRQRGIAVLQAREAPPNDGGVALGQAWAAIRSTALRSTPGASPDASVDAARAAPRSS